MPSHPFFVSGTLSVTLVAKASTKADKEVANTGYSEDGMHLSCSLFFPSLCQAVEKALCQLKYGSIGLNVYGLNTIMFPQLVWGGYSKEASPVDLQSGIGWVRY